MKKKLLSLLLAGAMVLGMAGCTSKPTEGGSTSDSATGGYELALITDFGSIDDKSFNQGSWEGLEKYAKENDITCKYYNPSEQSAEACEAAIDLAVKGGAKVIVTPGFSFEIPVLNTQTKYPDVNFIIIDAAPQDADGNLQIEDNVHSIFYAEQQAGYLAGYAAVQEGYKQLGFMGGIAVPSVIRYGYGFIEGADAAAKELGLSDINIKYTYTGNFDASPETQEKAASWYKEGTECIFACGGEIGNAIMKAAEEAGTYVIGVDVDQSSASDTVITSAMKNLGDSIYDAVGSCYDDSFEGGKSVVLTAKEDGIGLPMDTSKFKVFNQKMYDDLYAKLQDGIIKVDDDTVAAEAADVPTEIVTVEEIK
ncbi:MAG: BMP family ABC transporter substrate-binding protein [Lachnospiraceae bacterium]|nr:BMP family ABC transporter substrate-binding protein [Lachnospiraceae bacterium]